MVDFNLQEESQQLADPSTYTFDDEIDFGNMDNQEVSALLEGTAVLYCFNWNADADYDIQTRSSHLLRPRTLSPTEAIQAHLPSSAQHSNTQIHSLHSRFPRFSTVFSAQ